MGRGKGAGRVRVWGDVLGKLNMLYVCGVLYKFPFVLKTNKHYITNKMQEVKIKSCQRKTTQLKYRYLKILQILEVFVLSYFFPVSVLCCSSERLKLEAAFPAVTSRGQRFFTASPLRLCCE